MGPMSEQITLASDRTPEVLSDLGVSEGSDTWDLAMDFAKRYGGMGETIGRTPDAVAAGAVYLAVREENQSPSRADVAEAAGVTALTVTNAMKDIAAKEGLDEWARGAAGSPRERSERKEVEDSEEDEPVNEDVNLGERRQTRRFPKRELFLLLVSVAIAMFVLEPAELVQRSFEAIERVLGVIP